MDKFKIQTMARDGNVDAQYNLALMYHHGDGVEKDIDMCKYWLQMAANQGDSEAKQDLLNIIEYKDWDVLDIKTKASQGHVDAQYNLGVMYYQGDRVEKNVEKSTYWFQKAADQGDSEAFYNLLESIENKSMVISKIVTMASKGNVAAQYTLGVKYYHGDGVERNIKESIYWLEMAATKGSVNAQYNLGIMYHHGDCVLKDVEKSIYWLKMAANQGDQEALEFILEIEDY